MPLNNFGSTTFGFRGAQPDNPFGYTTLLALGVKTIVKLNNDGLDAEREACERHGFVLVPAPLEMFGNTTANVRAIVAKLDAARSAGPIFIHCTHGRDRTGMVCAAYRMIVEHWNLDLALIERGDYGVQGFVLEAANIELTQILKDIAAGK